MKFRIYVPENRWVADELLVGLAERANKRLGAPLQQALWSEELMWQAEIEGLFATIPDGGHLVGEHMVSYPRAKLVQLARRHRRRAAQPERKEP